MFYTIMLFTVQYFALIGLTVLNTTATALALDQIDLKFNRAHLWITGFALVYTILPSMALGGLFWG